MKKLSTKDFEQAWGCSLSRFVQEKITNSELNYSEVTPEQSEKLAVGILNDIFSGLKKAGKHRSSDWELGWAENRDATEDFLIPRYFGKLPYIRWMGNFLKVENKNFEYYTASILQYHLFEKFLKQVDNIYEFGCGTGHNLLRAHEVNPKATIHGLDWAESSQQTIERINSVYSKNFKSKKFDFFNIDNNYKLERNSGVYTFAALEQVGKDHVDFVDYLIKNNPQICLHVEPIAELLNPQEKLLDFLSVKYFEERNYLNGFYDHLKKIESSGKIDIIYANRSNIGSFYVDGYSIVAWRPKCQN